MTNATDITIKKSDGTTDVVWTLITGSGGDKSPAVWRSNTAVGTAGQRPAAQVQARWNGDQTARRVDYQVTFPSVYTDADSSLSKVRSVAVFQASGAVPMDMTDIDRKEFAAQCMNLMASLLFKSGLDTGYAPN
jgi:hypothetical protein